MGQIAEWAKLDLGDVREVVDEWREFLNADPGRPPRYRVYHRSFAEFLDEAEDLRWYHEKIAETALAKVPGL